MKNLIYQVLYVYSYPVLFGLSFVYFLVLYFVLAPVFNFLCQLMARQGVLKKIQDRPISKSQIHHELWHSFTSIIVFGFSLLPIAFLVRSDHITLAENTLFNTLWGLLALTLWNEVHFFLVHRLMHFRFFMRHIHYVHHRSGVPSVYSVYSFHWLEALLLSTVPLTLAPWLPLSPLSIFLYPIVSILLNYAGHCNYRFGGGQGNNWFQLGSRHNKHHSQGHGHFGFALPIFDKILKIFTRS